jgi:hypothetical protein
MHNPNYYRQQAARARRLADGVTSAEAERTLARIAQDYDDLAEDLENGAVEIRHPELMPQNDHHWRASRSGYMKKESPAVANGALWERRAVLAEKGVLPVWLGLVADIKFFGRHKGGWIRDGVILSLKEASVRWRAR